MKRTTIERRTHAKNLIIAPLLLLGALGPLGCSSGSVSSVKKTPAPRNQESTVSNTSSNAGACAALTTRLKQAHRALQECSNDEDCNYVDRFYQVVDRNDVGQFVTTFDCALVSPLLVVANGLALESQRGILTQLQQQQAAACAHPEGTVTCLALDGFGSETPPACVRNRCQSTVNQSR